MIQIIVSVLCVCATNVVVSAYTSGDSNQSITLCVEHPVEHAAIYSNRGNILIANKLQVDTDYELTDENDPLEKKFLELSSPVYKSGTNRTIGLSIPNALDIEKNCSTLQAQIHLRNCVFRI
ncbi:MAG: hypothetical protein U0Y96_07680 [Candidatus Kapaibacterium sp.]